MEEDINTVRGSLEGVQKDVVYIGKWFENVHRVVMNIIQNIMKAVTKKVSKGVRRENSIENVTGDTDRLDGHCIRYNSQNMEVNENVIKYVNGKTNFANADYNLEEENAHNFSAIYVEREMNMNYDPLD